MKNFYTKILIYSLSIYLLGSCAIPRCRGRQCTVRMVHYHMGYEYRGVSLWDWHFKYKNPRYGEGYPTLVNDPTIENPTKKRSLIKKWLKIKT